MSSVLKYEVCFDFFPICGIRFSSKKFSTLAMNECVVSISVKFKICNTAIDVCFHCLAKDFSLKSQRNKLYKDAQPYLEEAVRINNTEVQLLKALKDVCYQTDDIECWKKTNDLLKQISK